MENDPGARSEFEALGLRNVPVTVVGEKRVVGFNRDELSRIFDLASAAARGLVDPVFFSTLDKMLEAVIRAARQVPSSHFNWTTPDRNRLLKVFCYHILADPNHVLDAISSQKYDGSFKLTYAGDSAGFGDMEMLARFGEKTRARLRQASSGLSAAELERPIQGYAGRTNGHELLGLVLSHAAHHLRQLYAMLRMIGIEPAEPLAEPEFQGIPMPKDLW